MDSNVNERHQAIRQIIAEEMVEDQETLAWHLKNKFGLAANQVQVSRDLRKLGIGKQMVGGKMVYELPDTNQTFKILRLAIIDVKHNEMMIVVKTVPGLAPFVGDYLDGKQELGILGTLSGENVVFVSPATIKNIKETYHKVCLELFFKSPVGKP